MGRLTQRLFLGVAHCLAKTLIGIKAMAVLKPHYAHGIRDALNCHTVLLLAFPQLRLCLFALRDIPNDGDIPPEGAISVCHLRCHCLNGNNCPVLMREAPFGPKCANGVNHGVGLLPKEAILTGIAGGAATLVNEKIGVIVMTSFLGSYFITSVLPWKNLVWIIFCLSAAMQW